MSANAFFGLFCLIDMFQKYLIKTMGWMRLSFKFRSRNLSTNVLGCLFFCTKPICGR